MELASGLQIMLVLNDDGYWADFLNVATPDLHAASHENGGADEISLADLSGEPADTVNKTLFNANTILAADADDTPAALEITEQTVLGRLTGGNIKPLSVAELQALLFSAALPEDTGMTIDVDLSADGKYSPVKKIAGVAGTNLAYGEVVYLASADSKWEKAKADAESTTRPLMGIVVVAGNEDAAITVMLEGGIREDDWNWTTPGAPLFLSTATAGAMQEGDPAAGNQVRIVGYVLDANSIYFDPEKAWDKLAA